MRIFTTLLIALIVVCVTALVSAGGMAPRGSKLTSRYTYDKYVKDFGKHHRTPEEHAVRRSLYDAELATVLEHNNKGTSSYFKGMNHMSDWTKDEKMSLLNPNYMQIKQSQAVKPTKMHVASRAASGTLPKSVDWTAVTPPILTTVKDQGFCGSCWAHASTETAESRFAIASGKLFVLSQEQVTSCTPNPDQCGGTGGCNGATHELAFDYMTNAGGLQQEWSSPYTSYFGVTPQCSPPSPLLVYAKFSGYVKVPTNDAAAVLDAVVDGPLAVVVDASEWFNYDSGVYDGCKYSNNISLDHGVQLVGYGYDATLGVNYLKIRNSWSANFGEDGFIRLARAPTPAQERCGWNVNVSNGIACKGQTAPEWTCGQCGVYYDVTHPIPDLS